MMKEVEMSDRPTSVGSGSHFIMARWQSGDTVLPRDTTAKIARYLRRRGVRYTGEVDRYPTMARVTLPDGWMFVETNTRSVLELQDEKQRTVVYIICELFSDGMVAGRIIRSQMLKLYATLFGVSMVASAVAAATMPGPYLQWLIFYVVVGVIISIVLGRYWP